MPDERVGEVEFVPGPGDRDVEKAAFLFDKWYALAPAVDPKRSPLDIFHQVSVLLPEKGFRLTSFEVQNSNTVIVRGEGATMANALKIKGAIEEAPGLADFSWEIPPPTSKGGLVELVATGTYQFSGNEEE